MHIEALRTANSARNSTIDWRMQRSSSEPWMKKLNSLKSYEVTFAALILEVQRG